MSAERLREAATKLREVAAAATTGPWTYDPSDSDNDVMAAAGHHVTQGGIEGLQSGVCDTKDAAYIAMMSPPVALALADWLEGTASDHEATDRAVTAGRAIYTGPVHTEALAVADAILGDTP